MLQLPPEIWIYIAHHLPSHDLRQVYAVNSTLFHVSMDHRWGEIVVENKDLLEVGHLFKRLSDPFIASRVEKLILRLSSLETRPRTSRRFMLRPISTFASLVSGIHQRKSKQSSRPSTFSDFCSVFIQCVPQMINVKELTIDSWNSRQTVDVASLYRCFWTFFGSKLERLVIVGCLDSHRDVILSQPTLSTALKSLKIDFAEDIISANFAEDQKILTDVVAPFVKNLSSHLQGLSIWYWATTLDVSPFFAVCDSFPRLESLAVRMSFDKALIDPSGLQRLISSTSGTLKCLELRLNPSHFLLNHEANLQLGGWVVQCLKDEQCFTNVEVLDLYTSAESTGLQAIDASIRRSSRFLRSLVIRDTYWTLSMALMIVEAMTQCSRLTNLRMNIFQLDIELWDRMAESLPNLEKLALGLSKGDAMWTQTDEEFSTQLRTRRYDKWKIKELSIWRGGAEVSKYFMLRFCVSIPSIESFFGRPPCAPATYLRDGEVDIE